MVSLEWDLGGAQGWSGHHDGGGGDGDDRISKHTRKYVRIVSFTA
jgi:hypothetical protein